MQCDRGCCLCGKVGPFLQQGWAVRCQLALLWNCSVPLFSKRAHSVFGLVHSLSLSLSLSRSLSLSLSLAIPQFKLLSRVSSLRLPSGHSGPVLTLSNAAGSSLFCPHLLVADVGVWGTFVLGAAFGRLICGFYLFFLPVRLLSEIRKLSPDPPMRGFPGVWKLPLL